MNTMIAESTKRTKSTKSPHPNDDLLRTYWICQLTGWTLVALFFTLLFGATMPLAYATMAAIYGWGSFTGLLLSHTWRFIIKERGWFARNTRPPWIGIGAIILCLGTIEAFLVGLGFAAMMPAGATKGWGWVPGAIFGWVTIFSVWTALYLYTISARRSKQLEAEALRLDIYAKDAELRALQAQVNPHFFFNSLNSVRGLIFENPNAAAQMIDQLAGIMRYALQSGDAAVSLSREMEAVNAYLAIEKIRFEDRLRVEIDIESGLHETLIPPMALQTLVENAVKYGVERNALGSDICISGKQINNMMRIEVANTGSIAPFTDSTKLGLENTRKRLQLLLNPAATLEIREEQGWVRVLMQWPSQPPRQPNP